MSLQCAIPSVGDSGMAVKSFGTLFSFPRLGSYVVPQKSRRPNLPSNALSGEQDTWVRFSCRMILVWMERGISILGDHFPHSLDKDVHDNTANSSWQSVSLYVTFNMALHAHQLEAPLLDV